MQRRRGGRGGGREGGIPKKERQSPNRGGEGEAAKEKIKTGREGEGEKGETKRRGEERKKVGRRKKAIKRERERWRRLALCRLSVHHDVFPVWARWPWTKTKEWELLF